MLFLVFSYYVNLHHICKLCPLLNSWYLCFLFFLNLSYCVDVAYYLFSFLLISFHNFTFFGCALYKNMATFSCAYYQLLNFQTFCICAFKLIDLPLRSVLALSHKLWNVMYWSVLTFLLAIMTFYVNYLVNLKKFSDALGIFGSYFFY